MKHISLDFNLLLLSVILTLGLLIYLLKRKDNRTQLKTIFILNLTFTLIISIGVIVQYLTSTYININPILWENVIYIGTCFLPVSIFFTGLIFTNTKIKFKNCHLLLFIIPILTLLILWTNDFHHLFYVNYSLSFTNTIYGPYFYIHTIYSYALIIIGIIKLLTFSIKNSGFFSKQSLLILIGFLCPIIVNLLGSFLKVIPMTVFATPTAFSISIFCFVLAIFKFDFLKIAPIALQRVVDRMSDGYVIINTDNIVIDYNQTFLNMFHLTNSIRNQNIYSLISDSASNIDQTILYFKYAFTEIKKDFYKTLSVDIFNKSLNKHFSVEISGILSDNNLIGILILFKDITQHKIDMEKLKNNQDTLMEKERLASLGQLIGGIAHNLKTPIMSISGAAEGLTDLVKEYDASIDDPEVNSQDHHDIASDMSEWISKIKTHTEYMSDVITTVKGQAVTLNNEVDISFTVGELLKRVNILMKHELKNSIIYLNVSLKADENTIIHGDVNSLVQVINNMISNSIQSYNGKTNEKIDLIVSREKSSLIISVKDYGMGMPKKVKEKLFKEMITTKGKNGTGLGLYMSYSTIKAHFGGNITVDSEPGKGCTFNIILPL